MELTRFAMKHFSYSNHYFGVESTTIWEWIKQQTKWSLIWLQKEWISTPLHWESILPSVFFLQDKLYASTLILLTDIYSLKKIELIFTLFVTEVTPWGVMSVITSFGGKYRVNRTRFQSLRIEISLYWS